MPEPCIVHMRLRRADDVPATNAMHEAYAFGLQDNKQVIVAGDQRSDGTLSFDFELTAKSKPGSDRPHFTGRCASGPPADRFVYLSWRSVGRGAYINRVKARLSPIDWPMALKAVQAHSVLVADMTGWTPGDVRKFVIWRLESRRASD